MISVNIDIPKTAKDAYDTIGNLVNLIRNVRTDYATSLPAHLKATNIASRLYIHDALYSEPIILHLISVLNQMYAGYIFTSLQINQYVEGANTVRQLLETVAGESYIGADLDYQNSNLIMCMEQAPDSKGSKLLSGRVIQVELCIPGANGGVAHKTKVDLFVQLIPYILSTNVSVEFLKLNFAATNRKHKLKAKEISLIADYFFHRDLINDKRRALKEDPTGLLYDMLSKSQNSLSKALMGYSGLTRVNHNTANAIMVVDKAVMNEVSMKQGIDINNASQRRSFFKSSMMMMIVVIDLDNDLVNIYFNGLENYGTYTFNMIQANSDGGTNKDALSMVDVMTAISRGMTPKL
jgi:hypothetical protein